MAPQSEPGRGEYADAPAVPGTLQRNDRNAADSPNQNDFWWEIVGELCEVSEWFAGGELTADEFRKCVVTFEAKKMERFGFSLQGGETISGNVQFTLSLVATGEVWVTVEVNPSTGDLSVF